MFEMNVPGHKVGLIIGRGGKTIKQLQERSGAKITIIQDSPKVAHEKPLRITGDPGAVEAAKELVTEILNRNDGTWVDSVLQGNVLDRNLMAFVAEGGVYNVSLKRRDQGTPVLSNPIQMLKIRSIQASPKRSKKKTRVVRRFMVQTQPMIIVQSGLLNDKSRMK